VIFPRSHDFSERRRYKFLFLSFLLLLFSASEWIFKLISLQCLLFSSLKSAAIQRKSSLEGYQSSSLSKYRNCAKDFAFQSARMLYLYDTLKPGDESMALQEYREQVFEGMAPNR
jgi:hypothetical protein